MCSLHAQIITGATNRLGVTRATFGVDFSRPSGTVSVLDLVPALKRRAIFSRPSGARSYSLRIRPATQKPANLSCRTGEGASRTVFVALSSITPSSHAQHTSRRGIEKIATKLMYAGHSRHLPDCGRTTYSIATVTDESRRLSRRDN
jgi:hypothetical protein